MYAIIETGGKQYKVTKNSVITVEKLDGKKGREITLKDVLLISDGQDIRIGQPQVEGAAVLAEVLNEVKGKKVISVKYRRRKASKTKKGHRQKLTKLLIKDISLA